MSYQLTIVQQSYTVVDDVTSYFTVLWHGQILAAGWNVPLNNFRAEVDHQDIYVKKMRGGYLVLAANVSLVFPDLDSQAYSLTVHIEAQGFEPVDLTINVPMNAVFPLAEQTILLNYQPLRIQGRVVMAIDSSPVADALVVVQDANTLALRSTLNFDHLATTTVRTGSLNDAGAAKVTTAAAAAGTQTLVLDSTAGLANGSILRVGTPRRYLVLVVTAVDAGASEVTVRETIQRTILAGEVVQPVNFVADGNSQPLAEDCDAGLGLLFLTANLTGTAVQIDDGNPNLVEYHWVGALADSDGFYRLDGVGRRERVTLYGRNPAVTHDGTYVWFINTNQPVNSVDLRLLPI